MRRAMIAALIVLAAMPGVASAATFYGGLDDGTTRTFASDDVPISLVTGFGSMSSSPQAVALAVTIPRQANSGRGDLYWTGYAGLDHSFEVLSLPASGTGMLTMKFAVSGFSANSGRFPLEESFSELDWQVTLSGPAGSFEWTASKWSFANGDNYQTADGANDDYSVTKSRQSAFGTFLIRVPLAVGTYYVSRSVSCNVGSTGSGGARCKAVIGAPLVVASPGALLSPSFERVGGVPEPGPWALMIAGFGFVGAAMRRRVLAAT